MMTDTELSTRVQMALNVKSWLNSRGFQEIKTNLFKRSAVVEATGLPSELRKAANCTTERCNGLTRRVWSAYYGGCHIIWRE